MFSWKQIQQLLTLYPHPTTLILSVMYTHNFRVNDIKINWLNDIKNQKLRIYLLIKNISPYHCNQQQKIVSAKG